MTQPTIEQMIDALDDVLSWGDFPQHINREHIQAARTTLTAQAGDGWKPIETAPKPSGVVALACFNKAFGSYFVFPGHWYSTGTKWVFDCHILGSEPEQPKFWQPMPPPPKAAAKGE